MSPRTLLISVLASIILQVTIQQHTSYNVTKLRPWRYDRRPKMGCDGFPMSALMPNRENVQRKILIYHNTFRARVIPKPTNMLRMKWHKGASEAAQKWSDQCMLITHDNGTDRTVPHYGLCGQNIFIATRKVPWLFAIKTWYLEKDNFTYGAKNNDLGVVGHYTQMVWASTHQIGCGLSKCHTNATGRTYYSYICNYCPIGNRWGQLGHPYRTGKPCGMCKDNCHAKALCTNPCHVVDLWANCKKLHKLWPHWLCSTFTSKGKDRLKNCKATCRCKNKIHD